MKIWIDLTNSPHVNFFAGLINELRKEHDVLLTSRHNNNTIELIELFGFSHHVIGKHPGKNKIRKVLVFITRVCQLFLFIRKKNIDVAISHSSFFSPVVARLLGIRVIYLNDNEHALGNLFSFIFANKVLVPEFLSVEKVKGQWAKAEKIIQYPGVKEGVYLGYYKPPTSSGFKIEGRRGRRVVFVRPEPWMAQYYRGKKNFIDSLLIELKDVFKIVLLPRDELQEEHYRHERFAGITVPEKSITLADVMENCDLFIGAGGTMTREAAVLGIPTISIYQDKLLEVDSFLIEEGFMVHKRHLNAVFVMEFLDKVRKRPPDKQLLHKGKEAYELIKKTLLTNLIV